MNAKTIHTYIERLSNLLRNEVRRAGSESGLQPAQLEALHYLSICNRYSDTPMGVTEYLGQTKGTVSQTLKVLERKGFISREVDGQDKRVIHLRATESGRLLLEKVVPAANFVKGCDSMDLQTQEKIEDSLKTLLRSIQKASGSKTFGVCRSCRYNRSEGDNSFYCELVKAPLTESDVLLICREHQNAA